MTTLLAIVTIISTLLLLSLFRAVLHIASANDQHRRQLKRWDEAKKQREET